MDSLVSPRNADCAERPTSTKSALLSTVVDSAQNGMMICRVAAPVIRGVTWLMNSPQETTASTPDASIEVGQQERRERSHQHRDALEHRVVHPLAELPAQQPDQAAGSAPRRRTPATSSQVTCQPVRCCSPTVTPTASP